MSTSEFSVSVGWGVLQDGTPVLIVQIQADLFELNVLIPQTEVPRLRLVEAANWDLRQSLQIGRCANSPVFWVGGREDGAISILVGDDDETWEVGVFLPKHVFQQLLDEVDAAGK
jgi:hypothetical protein